MTSVSFFCTRGVAGDASAKALLVCAVLLAAVAVHADDTIIPVTVSGPASRTVQSMTGMVTAVSCADPAQGQRSEMSIRSDSGRVDTVLIKATTTLYDNHGNAMALEALRRNQKVKVKYITSIEGVREALSIMVAP